MTERKVDVVEELLAQRDRVLFGKWVQGAPTREGEACLGFYCTQTHTPDNHPLETMSNAAWWTLFEAGQGLFTPSLLTTWNDEKGRTKQEVLDVLDRAIQIAKEKG